MRHQGRLGGVARSERLIDTFLHQVICEVGNVSHDQHPA